MTARALVLLALLAGCSCDDDASVPRCSPGNGDRWFVVYAGCLGNLVSSPAHCWSLATSAVGCKP